jgi:hypothetical protein
MSKVASAEVLNVRKSVSAPARGTPAALPARRASCVLSIVMMYVPTIPHYVIILYCARVGPAPGAAARCRSPRRCPRQGRTQGQEVKQLTQQQCSSGGWSPGGSSGSNAACVAAIRPPRRLGQVQQQQCRCGLWWPHPGAVPSCRSVLRESGRCQGVQQRPGFREDLGSAGPCM